MSNASILLEDVSVVFGTGAKAYAALTDINLNIEAGERVGVIGPNGAGKSTLLRLMNGIYPPTEGRVRVRGKVSGLFQMGLGMQLDSSGLENIILNGMLSGQTKDSIKRILPSIVEFCDLGEFLERPLRTYSQGMAMRVKFACATAFSPDILLLDEWLGAGDSEFQLKARDRMDRLDSEANIVVFATHNIPLMKQFCSKAIWLAEGKQMMFGEIDNVLSERRQALKL